MQTVQAANQFHRGFFKISVVAQLQHDITSLMRLCHLQGFCCLLMKMCVNINQPEEVTMGRQMFIFIAIQPLTQSTVMGTPPVLRRQSGKILTPMNDTNQAEFPVGMCFNGLLIFFVAYFIAQFFSKYVG